MALPREVTIVLSALLGLLMIADYFVKSPYLNGAAAELQSWVVVIAGFAMVLATLNLIKVNLGRVSQHKPGWQYNGVTIAMAVIMTLTGLLTSKTSPGYKFLFDNVLAPTSSTLFALMIFFVSSASYRAFKVRNYQAALLLVSAMLVLLGGAPAGATVSVWLPKIRDWFLDVPTVVGNRAIVLTAAVGTVALGFKVLTGREKGFFGGGE